MLILLPPSETKRPGGEGRFDPASLSSASSLSAARTAVRDALEQLCTDEDAAQKALKLGARNLGEIQTNLHLASSGTLPAIDRYTGVLYEALASKDLAPAARQYVFSQVAIQSALFGLIRGGDQIPAYRLSATTRLPDVGRPLKRVWSDAHGPEVWTEFPFILDLRSKAYAELAPAPPGRALSVSVLERAASGAVRALNHFNKAAKGELVARLAADSPTISSAHELLEWAGDSGIEMELEQGQLTLIAANRR